MGKSDNWSDISAIAIYQQRQYISNSKSNISAIAVGTATLDVHPGVTILCAGLHHLVIFGDERMIILQEWSESGAVDAKSETRAGLKAESARSATHDILFGSAIEIQKEC